MSKGNKKMKPSFETKMHKHGEVTYRRCTSQKLSWLQNKNKNC